MGADDPGTDGMLSPVGWWLVTAPMDLRCGMDRLLVHVRETLERHPFDGAAYVFRNRAATRIKVLCCDTRGYGWPCADCRRVTSSGPLPARPPGHSLLSSFRGCAPGWTGSD